MDGRVTTRCAVAGVLAAGMCLPALGAGATTSDQVLVKLAPGADRADRAGVLDALDGQEIRPVGGGWVVVERARPITDVAAESRLEDEDAVRNVELDTLVRAEYAPNDPMFSDANLGQWALENTGLFPTSVAGVDIDASSGWSAADANDREVVVAVVDSGMDPTHPDLANQMWRNPDEIAGNGVDDDHNGYVDDVNGWDFRNRDKTINDADESTHGIHVAGIIAAERDNARQVTGVAPTARIMSAKFIGGGGTGSISDAVTAIWYAIDNGAEVINGSYGSTTRSTAECDAYAEAIRRGITIVVAAGNDGSSLDSSPKFPAGCWPSTAGFLTVANVAPDGSRATSSNWSPTIVDLGAPGTHIQNLAPAGGVTLKTGTSMASPMVAGIAAFLRAKDPTITPAEIDAALKTGGRTIPSMQGITVSGTLANLPGAMQAAGIALPGDTPTPPSSPSLPPATPTLTAPASGTLTNATSVRVSWAAPSDTVTGWEVRRNGTLVATLGSTTLAYDLPLPTTGAVTVSVRARNAAGSSSDASATLTVDRAAPGAPALTAPVNNVATSASTLTLNWRAPAASQGVSGYELTQVGGATTTLAASARSHTVTLPGTDGTVTYQLRALDAVGNRSAPATRAIVVDRTAPPVPSGLIPADGGLAPARPTFSWTKAVDATSGVAGYVIKVGTGADLSIAANRYTAPRALSPGAVSWKVRSRDRAGNLSAWTATRTAVVAPPLAKLGAPASKASLASPRPTFSWSASAGAARYTVLIDGSVIASGITATSWTPTSDLADGAHTWAVRALDADGLFYTPPARSVIIDTVAPAAPAIVSPAANADVPGLVTMSWGPVSGAVRYRVYRDSTLVTTTTARGTRVDVRATSAPTLSVRAEDRAGNLSTAATRQVTVDTTAPTAPTMFASVASQAPAGMVTFAWDAPSDNRSVAGLTLKVGARSIPLAASMRSYALTLRRGTYGWSLTARDAAGNTHARTGTIRIV